MLRALKKGADVNLIGSIGWNPLTYAMHKKNVEIIEFLVANGAKMNDLGMSYVTPFQIAILQNDMEIIKFFKDKGANLSIRDLRLNNNSFELAMKDKNRVDVLKQLLFQ